MKIFIEESDWCNYTEDREPNIIKKYEYELKLNEKYIVKSRKTQYLKTFFFFFKKNMKKDIEDFSFIIKEVGKDYVVVRTNFYSKEGNFKIKLNDVIKFSTPTMDARKVYKMLLK